jgi:outer membrane beta-barrel protein
MSFPVLALLAWARRNRNALALIVVPLLLASTPSPALATDCYEESIRGELDQPGERQDITRRDFIKTGRVELTAIGGYQGSDIFSSSYVYGGAISYHLFEGLAVEGTFLVSRANADILQLSKITTGVTTFVGERVFEGFGAAVWSPIHAKMKFGNRVAHLDFYLAGGAGVTFSSFVRGVTFNAGAGTKIFLNRWLAMRIDVRDHISQQELVGENHIVNNVQVTLGLSAFFPFKG